MGPTRLTGISPAVMVGSEMLAIAASTVRWSGAVPGCGEGGKGKKKTRNLKRGGASAPRELEMPLAETEWGLALTHAECVVFNLVLCFAGRMRLRLGDLTGICSVPLLSLLHLLFRETLHPPAESVFQLWRCSKALQVRLWLQRWRGVWMRGVSVHRGMCMKGRNSIRIHTSTRVFKYTYMHGCTSSKNNLLCLLWKNPRSVRLQAVAWKGSHTILLSVNHFGREKHSQRELLPKFGTQTNSIDLIP